MIFLQLIAALCILSCGLSSTTFPASQLSFLFDLYSTCAGEQWIWNNPVYAWDFSIPSPNPCVLLWEGILCKCHIDNTDCNTVDNTIISLNLDFHEVFGRIPSSIDQLIDLTSLSLANNALLQDIPSSLYTLRSLKELNLNNNYFEGTLSEDISQLTELVTLDFSYNRMYGNVSETLYSSLLQLTSLKLAVNGFMDIVSPKIGLLTELTIIDLSANHFHSSIPKEICDCSKLTSLIFANNHLNGSIPECFYEKLVQLTKLNIELNQFTGTISSTISELTSLKFLILDQNYFSHTIPSSIGGLSQNLTELWLHDNLFSGSIPSSIGFLTNLVSLKLYLNNLDRSLPHSFCNLTKMNDFELYNNSLTGTLPSCFGDIMSNLQYFKIQFNQFFGSLPERIGSVWKKCLMFDISNNLFDGTLPSSLNAMKEYIVDFEIQENSLHGNLTIFQDELLMNVHFLNTRNNFLSGALPEGSYSQLVYYVHSYNLFTGNAPHMNINPALFSVLDIGGNYLDGIFPVWVLRENSSLFELTLNYNFFHGNLNAVSLLHTKSTDAITKVSLDNNLFSGSIPSNICVWRELYLLSLYNNQFSGIFPRECLLAQNNEELEVLLLQGNQFSGNINDLLSNYTNHHLTFLDLSNNKFTGTLPKTFFQNNKKLKTFAASSNCLQGSLPEEICSALYLVALSLDGINTGENCRIPIINDDLLHLNAFLSKYPLEGTIPSCYFALSQLRVLYISGNSLGGSLSDNDITSISPYLTDLSLSHNQLSGSIPSIFFTDAHKWSNIDLSYNRISGTIPNDIEVHYNESSPNKDDDELNLSLEVNRFSGEIPRNLKLLQNIAILSGNMFSCTRSKDDLPIHDTEYEVYNCGSDLVNRVFYLWIMVFFLLLALYLWLRFKDGATRMKSSPSEEKRSSSATMNARLRAIWMNFVQWKRIFYVQITNSLTSQENSQLLTTASEEFITSFNSFKITMILIRSIAQSLTLVIIVILLPIYAILGIFNRTYSFSYAWTVSAIYLNGLSSTIFLALLFSFFLLLILYLFFASFPATASSSSSVTCRSLMQSIKTFWKGRKRTFLIWLIMWMINGIIMILADSLYIYLMINRSQNYVGFIQLLLALFKLGWNDFGIYRLLVGLKYFFYIYCCGDVADSDSMKASKRFSYNKVESSESDADVLPLSLSSAGVNPLLHTLVDANPTTDHDGDDDNEAFNSAETMKESSLTNLLETSQKDVFRLSTLAIVNKIIIPCLAIALINPNCFYEALVAAPPVKSVYNLCIPSPYYFLEYYDCINILGSGNDNIDYNPVFSYRYQCSASFLTDYIPVYLFLFLWTGCIVPLLILVAEQLSSTQYFIKKKEEHPEEAGGWLKKVARSFIYSLLPVGWKSFNDPTQEQLIKDKLQSSTINRKQLLTIRISYTLAVLIVFGSLFPPLSAIACFSVFSLTLLEERMTFTLLKDSLAVQMQPFSQIEDQNSVSEHYRGQKTSHWYLHYMITEFRDISSNYVSIIRVIVGLGCCLYSMVLFDTCGDSYGWKYGMIPAIIFFCLFSLTFFISRNGVFTNTNNSRFCLVNSADPPL